MAGSLAWRDRLYGVACPAVIVSFGIVLISLVVYGPECFPSKHDMCLKRARNVRDVQST